MINKASLYPLFGDYLKATETEGWMLKHDSRNNITLINSPHQDIFKNDNEAWDFMIKKAMSGSIIHVEMIQFLKSVNHDEFCLWINDIKIYRDYQFLLPVDPNMKKVIFNRLSLDISDSKFNI